MSKLVTYEQAKKLEKLGFNRECLSYYLFDKSDDKKADSLVQSKKSKQWNGLGHLNTIVGYCSAPTVSEALDFIREEKGVRCAVELVRETTRFYEIKGYKYGGAYIRVNNEEIFLKEKPTHPEAETTLLNAVLEYLGKEDYEI